MSGDVSPHLIAFLEEFVTAVVVEILDERITYGIAFYRFRSGNEVEIVAVRGNGSLPESGCGQIGIRSGEAAAVQKIFEEWNGFYPLLPVDIIMDFDAHPPAPPKPVFESIFLGGDIPFSHSDKDLEAAGCDLMCMQSAFFRRIDPEVPAFLLIDGKYIEEGSNAFCFLEAAPEKRLLPTSIEDRVIKTPGLLADFLTPILSRTGPAISGELYDLVKKLEPLESIPQPLEEYIRAIVLYCLNSDEAELLRRAEHLLIYWQHGRNILSSIGGSIRERIRSLLAGSRRVESDLGFRISYRLGWFDSPAFFSELTQSPDEYIRASAASYMNPESKEAKAVLLALLEDPSALVRISAVESLYTCKDNESLSRISRLLRDEDAGVRSAAVVAFRCTEGIPWIEEILDLLHDPGGPLTAAVKTMLWVGNKEEHLPLLKELLSSDKARDDPVLQMVVWAFEGEMDRLTKRVRSSFHNAMKYQSILEKAEQMNNID